MIFAFMLAPFRKSSETSMSMSMSNKNQKMMMRRTLGSTRPHRRRQRLPSSAVYSCRKRLRCTGRAETFPRRNRTLHEPLRHSSANGRSSDLETVKTLPRSSASASSLKQSSSLVAENPGASSSSNKGLTRSDDPHHRRSESLHVRSPLHTFTPTTEQQQPSAPHKEAASHPPSSSATSDESEDEQQRDSAEQSSHYQRASCPNFTTTLAHLRPATRSTTIRTTFTDSNGKRS